MKQLSIIIICLIAGLSSVCLKGNDAILKKLQETSHISYLIAQRFLQERASSYKRKTQYNQNYKSEKLSVDDKIFENPSCDIHDIVINVTREECDDQESIILVTKVFGTIDDFEDTDIIEAEKRLLKFVLIKAYQMAHAKNKEKSKKTFVTVLLDANTKVTLQPTFVTIKKGPFDFYGHEESKDHKGMQLLTVLSKAEFDALAQRYFTA